MIQKVVLVIVVLFLLRGLVAPGRQPGDQPPVPVRQPKEAESTKPAEEQLRELREVLVREIDNAKQRLSVRMGDALGNALAEELPREGGKYFSSALKTNDPIETELLTAWMAWSISWGSVPKAEPDEIEHLSHSIFLLRPGKPSDEVETTILMADDKPFLRFTRGQAAIERPLAILTGTSVVKAKLFETQRVLIYGPDGKWVSLKAND